MTGRSEPDREDPMPWIRLDDSLFRDPAFLRLPDDTTRLAYLAIAAAGSLTDPPGEWPSITAMQATLPAWLFDAVGPLLAAGLLTQDESATIRIVGRFYPSETPGAIRTARHRDRHRSRTEGVTSSSSSQSSSPPTSSLSPTPLGPPLPDDWTVVARHAEDLTGQPYAIPSPWSRLGEIASRMLAKHGRDQLLDAMSRAAIQSGPMPTAGQIVLGAGNILDAIPRATADCATCLNTGVTASGRRCPDCTRGRGD